MSVASFIEHRRAVEVLFASVPECWVIAANSVFANFEHTAVVAAFDTQAAAWDYVRAAKLETPGFQEGDQATSQGDARIGRTFRRDSLLWNFNPHQGGTLEEASLVERITNPRFCWDPHVAVNPPPLSPAP